jgi:hypothetical protein
MGISRPRFVLSYYIKLKNIPFSHIYKEFNVYLIDQYKIREIKNTIFYFERYSNQIKICNKINSTLKHLYIEIKTPRIKKNDDKLFFFKKYYENFISTQENYI